MRAHLGVPVDEETDDRDRLVVLYARVSSSKQKEAGDLQRQVDLLKQKWPSHHKVITDVASGLNFKRKGLLALLELVESHRVLHVVVTYRDRLARFGVELIERTIRRHGATLNVVSHNPDSDSTQDDQSELAEDLLAVCNFFVARNNGRRAAALRRGRQQEQSESSEDEESGSSNESDEDPPPPPKRQRSRVSTTNIGHGAVDV